MSPGNKRWVRTRPYALAMLFVFFVPGLALSFSRGLQLVPAPVVQFLYPYTISGWEKVFVALVETIIHPGRPVTVMDLSLPSASNEQVLVVAFISFFLVFLIVGLQTWADALFSDQRIENLSSALIMLAIGILLRSDSIYVLFTHAGTAVAQQPTHWIVSQSIRFLAPAQLVFSTCMVAKSIHTIGRITGLFFSKSA